MTKKRGPRHILWAPWRMEYIKRAREGGCFLCRSLRSRADRANGVVRRGRTCAVVLNRYPYTGGHLMVATLRHVAELRELQPAELNELMRLTVRSVDWLQETLRPHGFNIGLNLGEAAGAGLKNHVHLHVVPRWKGDTNFMPVIGKTQVTPISMETLWDLLRRAVRKSRSRRLSL